MYCVSPSFVLGFHGCEREIGELVQLAIRNVKSIKGYFRVLDLTGKPVEFVRAE